MPKSKNRNSIRLKNAAANAIASIASTTYIPYVPIQTTTLLGTNSKLFPSIELKSNNPINDARKYQLAIGKSYQFLIDYSILMKEEENEFCLKYNGADSINELRDAIRRHVYDFAAGQTIFISEISEVCNQYYYASEYSNNQNDDIVLTLIQPEIEKAFILTATSFIDLLEPQIIRETLA